jgi:hypothetical protein
MAERFLVLICVYGAIALYDRPFLQSSPDKRGKAVYALLMIVTLGLAVDYLITLRFDFPNLIEMAERMFGGMARAIDRWLSVKP